MAKTLNLPYKAYNQRWNGSEYIELVDANVPFNPNGKLDYMYLYGCSRCSVACILSNLNGKEINPLYIPHDDGYVTFSSIPSHSNIVNVSRKITYLPITGVTSSNYLSKIKENIDANRPVILRCYNSSGLNHFVVAYGYNNECTSTSDVKTYDTVASGGIDTPKYGQVGTLYDVFNLNKMSSVNNMFTYI